MRPLLGLQSTELYDNKFAFLGYQIQGNLLQQKYETSTKSKALFSFLDMLGGTDQCAGIE